MSVLVNNMDMPKSCFDCPLSYVFPVDDDVFLIKCAPLNRKCSEDVKRNDCPLVEAPEPKHGKWNRTDAYPHHVYCSVCFKTYIPNDSWQVWQDKYGDGGLPRDYCPNCGATMDGYA